MKIVELLIVCMLISVLGVSVSSANQKYIFEVNHVLKEDNDISIEIIYTNTDKVAHCILLGDFNAHPWREALRIANQRGMKVPYIGRRSSQGGRAPSEKSDREIFDSFYILPKGMFIRTIFNISKNYSLSHGKYFVRYSLPVTPCKYVNDGLLQIPTSYDPFLIQPPDNEGWDSQLETIKKHRKNWAKVGFFAEMEVHSFEID